MGKAKDLLLIETVVKLAAINKLLVSKNILNDKEINDEMTNISKELVEVFKSFTSATFESDTKN